MANDINKDEELEIAHPKTLIAVPIDLVGLKFKVAHGLMEVCTTDLLIDEELLNGDLSKCKEDGLTNEEATASWDVGNGTFKLLGAVEILNASSLAFTKNSRFSVKFHMIPKKSKKQHLHKIIIGMKDLRKLKFVVYLEDNMMH